jgi:hypothetical protein
MKTLRTKIIGKHDKQFHDIMNVYFVKYEFGVE